MINYVGTRTKDGVIVEVDDNGCRRPLRHVVVHSPTGFEWGYGGSGPSDLALSILADHLAVPHVAPSLYQSFKFDVIGNLEQNSNFVMPAKLVSDWLGDRWKDMSESQVRADFGGLG